MIDTSTSKSADLDQTNESYRSDEVIAAELANSPAPRAADRIALDSPSSRLAIEPMIEAIAAADQAEKALAEQAYDAEADTAPIDIVWLEPEPEPEPRLRDGRAGIALMREALRRQESAVARGRFARVIGRSPLHPDAELWYESTLGELEVARILRTLGPEWTVLHSVPVGSGPSTLEHIVLGPAGVFVITTKNHSGRKIWVNGSTFMVDRFSYDYMGTASMDASRVGEILSVVSERPITVTPIIVVVNPRVIVTGRTRPAVPVLASSQLGRSLQRRPRVLSERAIAHFSLFAEERSTWSLTKLDHSDLAETMSRFSALREEVETARQRSVLCSIIVGGVVAIAVASAVLIALSALSPAGWHLFG